MSLKVTNTRVLLKRLEVDIKKVLEREFSQEQTDNVTKDQLKETLINIIKSVEIVTFFDEEVFDISFNIQDGGTVEIVPSNFLSALWMKGINANEEGIIDNKFYTDIGEYVWDEENKVLGIIPLCPPDNCFED